MIDWLYHLFNDPFHKNPRAIVLLILVWVFATAALCLDPRRRR